MTLLWVVVGLVLLDQVLLFMERKGWIYWRRTKGGGGSGGDGALLELQRIMRPSVVHVQEAKKEQKAPARENGDPPDVNGRSGGS